jgi:hypothetical protein
MAVLVFSAGQTLRVPGPAAQVADSLVVSLGAIDNGWHPLPSGDATVLVNPRQIAYILEDGQVAETLGPR